MKTSLKNAIKQFLFRYAPKVASALQINSQRNHIERFERSLGLPQISKAFVARYRLKVLSGPFEGMVYVPQAVGSALVPKLLGCYEAELHDVLVNKILATEYSAIVDIGCAEGYYAIGLALRLPSAQIYAFDIDPLARKLCTTMARANNVGDRITVGDKCDVDRLSTLVVDRALIVCDCEGCEVDLLCPDLVPGMNSADILVELHDFENTYISQTIAARFEATHDITLLTSVERDASQYPALDFLEQQERHLAVNEFRPADQQWAFMTPKHGY
jgi:predicted O-methyltransferase YrrM